jgi:hypothetical protein
MSTGSAHDRLDARDELGPLDRLGHEPVGPETERLHGSARVRNAGDDEDRHVATPGAQLRQDLVDVHTAPGVPGRVRPNASCPSDGSIPCISAGAHRWTSKGPCAASGDVTAADNRAASTCALAMPLRPSSRPAAYIVSSHAAAASCIASNNRATRYALQASPLPTGPANRLVSASHGSFLAWLSNNLHVGRTRTEQLGSLDFWT